MNTFLYFSDSKVAFSNSFLITGQRGPDDQSLVFLYVNFLTSSPSFFIASVCLNDYKILKLLLEKWLAIASKTHYEIHFCVFTLEHGYWVYWFCLNFHSWDDPIIQDKKKNQLSINLQHTKDNNIMVLEK